VVQAALLGPSAVAGGGSALPSAPVDVQRPPVSSSAPGGLAARVGGRALRAVEQLAGGLGTALLALAVLAAGLLAAPACGVGAGLLVVPGLLRAVRSVADRERARLGRWGDPVLGPGPLPAGVRPALADPAVRRELRWLTGHATAGLLLGALGVLLPLYAVQYLTYPLWWRALGEGDVAPSPGFWSVTGWPATPPPGCCSVREGCCCRCTPSST